MPTSSHNQIDSALLASRLPVPALLERWADLWQADEVLRCTVRVNRRLSRSLGLCKPGKNLVDINPILLSDDNLSLLEETLCHELAHLVVHRRLGRTARPHGREWRILMQAAGHHARASIPNTQIGGPVPEQRRVRYEYEHRCPRCDARKIARRTSHRWRCAECVGAGYDGELEVIRHRID